MVPAVATHHVASMVRQPPSPLIWHPSVVITKSLRLVAAPIRRAVMSAMSKAAFARKYWDMATQVGTPHATTTFHRKFDKNDHWVFNKLGCEAEQYGARGMALGYLTKVRFVRFLQTRDGEQLAGVDCSRPGADAEREQRIRVVSGEFFDLLVRYSRTHPNQRGDYGNVARSRKLPSGSFCIFTGFSEALASEEFEQLRAAWKKRYNPAPALDVKLPKVPSVVDEVFSRFEPPPPPPPPPRAIEGNELLEREMVASFREALCLGRGGRSAAFGPSGQGVAFDAPLYFVQRNLRSRGPTKGIVRTTLVLKGLLRKRMRVRTLHSAEEIRAAFGRLRCPSN